MPRKPRFFLPHIPVHVVQRGHSREPVFFENNDYYAYLSWLKQAANRYGCAIHAYVLMTNHIHILATPEDVQGISRMMQYIGRHYVPYMNRAYGTTGSIWEGRYKASLVDNEQYLLTCMRYIELNPVRAGMTSTPGEYDWSSYRANVQGEADDRITPHILFKRLGKTVQARRDAYHSLFTEQLAENDLKVIRNAWQTGTPLGNEKFKQKIELKLNCKVGQDRRGRPKRASTP